MFSKISLAFAIVSRKAGFDIYSDYTYINEHGDLTESTQLKLMLEQTEEPTFADSDSSTLSKQSKLRKVEKNRFTWALIWPFEKE